MNQNSYNNQRELIEGDNVNVSNPNDGKNFINIFVKIIIIILVVIFSCDLISNIFIDNMPDKTQVAIENILSSDKKLKFKISKQIKYIKTIAKLQYIKKRIIVEDKNLQGKSDFPIIIVEDKAINAFISPNGTIYFTNAMLEEGFSEQELAFVLAHELGHYAHRDHLKAISRKLMIAAIFSFIGKDNSAGRIINGITETSGLSYSRRQEKNADIYASDMLKKLYGTNEGAISFINKIKEKEYTPEFLYYFSTHPSWKYRLKVIS